MTPAIASRKLFQLCFFSGLAALAVGACTVESSGGDDDDAAAGSGGTAGKGGSGGATSNAGKAGSATNAGTAGYGTTGGSAGRYTGGAPGAGEGGVPASQGGNGGEPASADNGGEPASAGAATAGASTGGAGAGGTDPSEFFAACNSCAGIICDTELEACSEDATCFGATDDDLGEYGCMLDCIDAKRAESPKEFIPSSEMSVCAQSCAGTGSGWSKGLSDLTRDVFDCLADGTVTPGSPWSAPTNNNCTNECFGAGN